MWFWSMASVSVVSASTAKDTHNPDVGLRAHNLFYTKNPPPFTKTAALTTRKVVYSGSSFAPKPVILPDKKAPFWPFRSGIDCAAAKCVALTFDDGPSEETSKLLDLLKAKDIKATFFVLGLQIEKYPLMLPRMLAEGHEIGNHTYHHKSLKKLSAADVATEVNSTQNLIFSLTGYLPHIIRPPMGEFNLGDPTLANYPIILWSADPWDWKYRNSATIDQEVMKQVKPGYIVIMHDIYPTSIGAVPTIIDTLKQQGYTFVTISELFGWQDESAPLPAGQVLRAR